MCSLWNITQSYKAVNYWYTQRHGWIAELLCWVKEAGPKTNRKRGPPVRVHLWNILENENWSLKTEGRSVIAGDGSSRRGGRQRGMRKCWGVMKMLVISIVVIVSQYIHIETNQNVRFTCVQFLVLQLYLTDVVNSKQGYPVHVKRNHNNSGSWENSLFS